MSLEAIDNMVKNDTIKIIIDCFLKGWKTACAVLPIPALFYLGRNKPKIFYFEAQILKKHAYCFKFILNFNFIEKIIFK